MLTKPRLTYNEPAPRMKRPYRPFTVKPGQVIHLAEGACTVLRVTEAAAIVQMPPPPPRTFTTRFGKTVTIQGRPALARISPYSEVTILKP